MPPLYGFLLYTETPASLCQKRCKGLENWYFGYDLFYCEYPSCSSYQAKLSELLCLAEFIACSILPIETFRAVCLLTPFFQGVCGAIYILYGLFIALPLLIDCRYVRAKCLRCLAI